MSELEPTRTYSNPTATEILRRLLDERGVEHEGGKRSVRWRDRNGVMMQAFPLANGELGMGVWSCTPEQAIAATLGAGTCHNISDFNPVDVFTCSECGSSFKVRQFKIDADGVLDDETEFEFVPMHCPWCGAKVVDE